MPNRTQKQPTHVYSQAHMQFHLSSIPGFWCLWHASLCLAWVGVANQSLEIIEHNQGMNQVCEFLTCPTSSYTSSHHHPIPTPPSDVVSGRLRRMEPPRSNRCPVNRRGFHENLVVQQKRSTYSYWKNRWHSHPVAIMLVVVFYIRCEGICSYSNWKVDGTVLTYWFIRTRPFTNLPFGIGYRHLFWP